MKAVEASTFPPIGFKTEVSVIVVESNLKVEHMKSV